ncbi:baseplate J/gp47 family protein [Zymobacter sp. IVIA_12111.31 C1]|uniref:baseplate J/gp47 family protein n=1 Tax=Zymobacter sp. IVIA_12111.31 C1 TaxID=3394854 RepID=UPI0039C2A081
MLIPGQNQLSKPEIVKIASFETLLEELKKHTVDYIAKSDASLAEQVKDTFTYESEILTKLAEAFVVYVQTRDRAYNERITQMLAWWAEGSNLDARLSDLGLERQVISPGDSSAYPPVAPTYESDEHARLRYYLAPHAPAAGSRMHYRREVLTLDERAQVSVTTPETGKVVVTYLLDSKGYAAQIKDGNGLRTAPGKVTVTVLSRSGDGTASDELLTAVRRHFARDDVVPGSDEVTVQGADILRYEINATVWINSGPDAALTQEAARKALQEYADEHHVLGGRIDRSWIDYVLHKAGAARIEVASPLDSIIADDHQAPYCSAINVEVRTS